MVSSTVVRFVTSFLDITDTAPIDGADIITTIDVSMQDLAERALLDELKDPNVNGNVGVAIVMEVATGDVKAIVNLDKCSDGEYREVKNHAVSDLLEPGSVFKTASIMTILDDGLVDTMYTVQTGPGCMEYVRTRHEGPQLDTWRIWNVDAAMDFEIQFKHRCQSYH